MDFVKFIKNTIIIFIHWLMKMFPLDRKKIVFVSYYGKNYSCNPRSIFEELKKSHSDLKYYWFLKDKKMSAPSPAITIHSKLSYIYHLSTALYWVDNCRKQKLFSPFRKQTRYLQTWHGTPLKKIEFDARHFLSTQYLEMCESDNRKIEYLLAYNSYCAAVFPGAFGIAKEKVVMTGSPRNDVLFIEKYNMQLRESILNEIGADTTRPLLLYMPTFRNDPFMKERFLKEVTAGLNHLCMVFGSQVSIVVRLHPNDSDLLSGCDPSIINASEYEDATRILLVADVLITDYSSVFFDYAILSRPIILYAFDLKEYLEKEREFYMDYSVLVPGPVVVNQFELADKVKDALLYPKKAAAKVCDFNRIYNQGEDGLASKRTIQKFISL